ncbi:MAG TPA: hypothetical protein VEB59_16560, partial [Gemmatimonadales bacterium]|nr:hypothetical protein [Gemmatimonadales bacterium]
MPVATTVPRSPTRHRPSNPHRNPLRIGVMLRAVGEYDGAGVYIRALLDALLAIDDTNQYVFFYDSPADRGRFADRRNVREVVVRSPGKLVWDQVAVPIAARRE